MGALSRSIYYLRIAVHLARPFALAAITFAETFMPIRSTRRAAFTLVELLVVIGIIALLISILLPALGKARKQALNANCMSNLRTIGQAITIYAAENKGKVPAHPGGGSWLWDVTTDTRDTLLRNGSARKVLYCPVYQEQDVDGLCDYNPTYSVLGYFFLLQRVPNMPTMPTLDATPTARKNYQATMVALKDPTTGVASAAETELVTDAVLSSGGNWWVKGGYAVPHLTSHMDTKLNRPEGGFILFMDGHVNWRGFKEMSKRAISGGVEFWF